MAFQVEKNKENERKKVFEKIMAENFLNWTLRVKSTFSMSLGLDNMIPEVHFLWDDEQL